MGGDENDRVEARACEWVAWWLWRPRREWNGPAVVLVRMRRLVIAIRPENVCEVTADDREHFVLRIAPDETPSVRLYSEADSGAPVRDVVYVPPSLADEIEGA